MKEPADARPARRWVRPRRRRDAAGVHPGPRAGRQPGPPQASGPPPTPPVPGAAPAYPAVTPPYPVSTPPAPGAAPSYPTSTPPYPASTPPYPASAPPYPTSTPPYPTSTPPYPMSAPPGGGYPPTAPYQTAAGPQQTGGFPATAVMPRSRPRPPAWLIVTLVAAIVVALAGAGTLAWSRFWGGDGVNERKVEFTPFQQIGSVPGPGSNYGKVFTTVTDDRAYVAHVREDDKLEIRAVQASTATELWRAETSIAASGWEQVASVSVGVAALTDGNSSSTPETLVVFDTEGREIWKYPIRRDDQIFFLGDAVVVVDRFANQLVGLRAADGTQAWRLDNPAKGTRKDTAVYPVNSYERLTGPGTSPGFRSRPGPATSRSSRWGRTGRCGSSTRGPAPSCAAGRTWPTTPIRWPWSAAPSTSPRRTRAPATGSSPTIWPPSVSRGSCTPRPTRPRGPRR